LEANTLNILKSMGVVALLSAAASAQFHTNMETNVTAWPPCVLSTCNPGGTGGWQHVQWWVHRVDGDTNCEGYPCRYYDMLGVDEIYTQFAMTEPAGPIPAGGRMTAA
jgi:hypothetical protein